VNRAIEFVVGRPRVVVAAWLVVLLAALAPAGGLQSRIGNGGYEVPGSQSQRVTQLTASSFPAQHGQALGAVLRSSAPDVAALRARAHRLMTALERRPGVRSIGSLYVSAHRRMAVLTFYLDGDVAAAQKQIPSLDRWVRRVAGARTGLVGEAASWHESAELSKRNLARAEQLTIPITLVILLVAFLSVGAALVPVGLAIVTLVIAFAGLGLLSHAIDMSVYVTNTAQLLGLGLSIDYSLFVVTRYREHRGQGMQIPDALRLTLQTTGRAILISGITVTLGLASVAALGVSVFSSMALGASFAAALAALGALTLVPAVLRIAGTRIDRFSLAPVARASQRGGLWRRLGALVVRRRWPVLAITTLLLLACSLPLLGSRLVFAGVDGLLPASNPQRQLSDAVMREFGNGVIAPIVIIARSEYGVRVEETALRQRGVATVLVPEAGEHGFSRVYVVPSASAGSAAADGTVRRVRAAVEAAVPAGAAFVGGEAALGVDLIARVRGRFPLMVALAAISAFALLLIALRSLVVPIKAVLTNLLSVAATLGLVTLVFQRLGGDRGLAWFVPPFLFAVVFGISMDYEIFLLSRVREEYERERALAAQQPDGRANGRAVTRALERSGRAITLAALSIMLVFATSANTSQELFRQLGVGMALAVLLDATVIRCGLVPAALAVLGARNWWLPRRLDRRLPRLAVEEHVEEIGVAQVP
jgi:putative drug exporter of the RND superfamily